MTSHVEGIQAVPYGACFRYKRILLLLLFADMEGMHCLQPADFVATSISRSQNEYYRRKKKYTTRNADRTQYLRGGLKFLGEEAEITEGMV